MEEENVTSVENTEEQTTQETQEEKTNLESEIATLKAELERARQEAKAEKQNVSKKERQLQSLRKQQEKIDGLETRLEVVTSMLADLVDRGDIEDEPQPKRRRSEEYLQKIQQKEKEKPKEPEFPPEYIEAAAEADRLAKSVGLDMEESDELAKAYRYFIKGKGDEGLEETKRVVEQIRKAQEESPKKKSIDELTDEEMEEIARKYMEKKGTLHTDAGTPTSKGRVFTRQQIAKMSEKEYEENREAIMEAYQAGRIK